MAAMNALVRVPEIQATMRELSNEMLRAGLIEETINDSMAALDEDGIEEAADAEVDAVLFDITKGIMGQAPAAGKSDPATRAADAVAEAEAEAMLSRLEGLRAT
jgi:charged multivesicular body protein 3